MCGFQNMPKAIDYLTRSGNAAAHYFLGAFNAASPDPIIASLRCSGLCYSDTSDSKMPADFKKAFDMFEKVKRFECSQVAHSVPSLNFSRSLPLLFAWQSAAMGYGPANVELAGCYIAVSQPFSAAVFS